MASPAPRPAHRWTPLGAVRIVALVATLALAVVGCASDSPETADVSTSASTDLDVATSVDDSEGDTTPTTAASDNEEPKPEPARTAGDVDASAGVQPDGFTTVTVRITSADGQTCDVCLWLADAGDERGRGLMGVTDLGEPVGMLFRFERSTSGNFFMFNTPMPLSIVWFDASGSHVNETDMAPCLVDDSSECERYGPGADYLDAIEMVQGELDVIGIGPGSTLEVLAEHDVCPEPA